MQEKIFNIFVFERPSKPIMTLCAFSLSYSCYHNNFFGNVIRKIIDDEEKIQKLFDKL